MSLSTFKVDLHMHTCVSKDGVVHPAEVIKIAKRRGLDRICITDHNTLAGALAARKIDPEFVIVGEEILTYNKKAGAFTAAHGLPVTAGSDAYTAMEIDAAYLEMPAFTTAEEFRANLPQAAVHGKLSPAWIHFFSRLNIWRGQFGLKPVIDPQ